MIEVLVTAGIVVAVVVAIGVVHPSYVSMIAAYAVVAVALSVLDHYIWH